MQFPTTISVLVVVTLLTACSGSAGRSDGSAAIVSAATAAVKADAPAKEAVSAPLPVATPTTVAPDPAIPTQADPITPAQATTDAQQVNDSIDHHLGSHARYQPFIHQFQAAVVAGDKQTVAGMVHYPFGATIDRKNWIIRDPAGFVAQYDNILTADIVQVVRDQKYADLFVNYRAPRITSFSTRMTPARSRQGRSVLLPAIYGLF